MNEKQKNWLKQPGWLTYKKIRVLGNLNYTYILSPHSRMIQYGILVTASPLMKNGAEIKIKLHCKHTNPLEAFVFCVLTVNDKHTKPRFQIECRG